LARFVRTVIAHVDTLADPLVILLPQFAAD